ncbi:hypothetical protein Tco_1409671 [Tanacetum coccineum]
MTIKNPVDREIVMKTHCFLDHVMDNSHYANLERALRHYIAKMASWVGNVTDPEFYDVPSLPLKSPVYHEPSVASVVSASVVDRSIGTDNPHLSLGSQVDSWCIEHLRYYFLGCLAEHPTFVGHSNLLIEVIILLAEHWEHSSRVDIKT